MTTLAVTEGTVTLRQVEDASGNLALAMFQHDTAARRFCVINFA